MDHFSAFDVDAAEAHEEQKAARHASVLFNTRATDRFLPFLRQAAHKDEFEARLALIERDLDRLAADITDETGHDAAYMIEHYKTHVAGGAFCDECRKWKSGPKAGLCVCDEEGSEDDSAEKESRTVEAMPGAPGQGWHGEAQPQGDQVCGHCGQPVDKLSNVDRCPHCGNSTGGPGLDQFGEDMWGKLFGPRGASTTVPFKIVATNEDNLGGKGKPSGPKIDKSRAGDEKSNKKRDPIDTDGGRYKTERQDVADSADYANEDFLEQTETVTDHDVDVAKKSEVKGDATKTWSGKGGQANPVTSAIVGEGVCPDCGAVTNDGICSNRDCPRSWDNSPEPSPILHPNEYRGPRDPQAPPVTSHFLSNEEVDRAIESRAAAEKAQCADCGIRLATKVNQDGIGRCDQCASTVEQAEFNEKRDKPPLDK